jgi:hypothetical protein
MAMGSFMFSETAAMWLSWTRIQPRSQPITTRCSTDRDGADAAIFNPKTKETLSSQVDGALTVVREKSSLRFVVEQTVQTKPSAKQMVWDSKSKRILVIAANCIPPPSPPPHRRACRPGPDGAGFIFNPGGDQVKSQNSYRNPMRTNRGG